MNLFDDTAAAATSASTVPTNLVLRDYQQLTVDNVLTELEEEQSTLVVLPTGCGKTICFAKIAEKFNGLGRVMLLVHREELMRQGVEKIEGVTSMRCDVEMGDRWADMQAFTKSQVVVSSIQTQIAGQSGAGRMTRFKPEDFALIIADEAHHAVSETWKRVINYYLEGNENCRLLGVTATPDRKDEKALGQIFKTVAIVYEPADAINDGWLVPVKQQSVYVEGLDLSQIKTTAGDLNGAELARVMEYEKTLHQMTGPTLDLVGDRRTLFFTASVAQAERTAEIFNRHKPACADWVCGKTPKVQREQIFRRYHAGEFQILVNVGIVTEGVDVPGIEVVAVGRPTKSRALYAQMLGRGTRPLPGVVDGPPTPEERRAAIAASPKPYAEVIDFVGNAGKHKLITPADVLGGNYEDAVVERAAELAKDEATDGQPVDVMRKLEEAKEIVRKETEAAQKRKKVKAKAKYSTRSIDPFATWDIEAKKERGWDKGKQLTEKQRKLLERQNVDPDSLTPSQARQVIGELFKRWNDGTCTLKQAKILKQYEYKTNVSKEAATITIDYIVANGWRSLSNEQKVEAAEKIMAAKKAKADQKQRDET